MRPRRGRGKPSAGDGSTIPTTAPALSFSIPLKDTSKPVAFAGDFQNHIALEFAMRYLCEIGATPTIENCRWVLREMPLENCSVTAAWRSRGCLADAIIIQPGGYRNGRGGNGGSAGGMVEASSPPTVNSPQSNASSGKETGSGIPAVKLGNANKSTVQAAPKGGATRREGSGRGTKGSRPMTASARTKNKPVTTQPASSMGKALPHKVSIFVDAVSSAIGPAIIETAKGSHATDISGAAGAVAASVAAILTTGTTTARDRNTRRRHRGELPVRDICTTSIGSNQRQWEQQQQQQQQRQQQQGHGDGPAGGGRKCGVLRENSAVFSGIEASGGDISDDGEGGTNESFATNGIAFAEARQKMLDPPKVDMPAIATIQAAFARNFPFHKHGAKFADHTVRSSVKSLITSEGPGRLIGLLSHYLFWIMLLPFAVTHKNRDDCFLLEMGNRLSLKKQQKALFRVADGGRMLPGSSATPVGPVPPETPTKSEGVKHDNDGDTSASANHNGKPEKGGTGGEQHHHQHSPNPSGGEKGGATSSWFPGSPEETDQGSRPRLTPAEAESLFVAVVEAWSSLRSSLGTSRHARLVQLPIAVAAVRYGVQTVLCNCYPFLDTKGGREGKKLLASLHEEVAARFIPRFYYEGPFTPVAEEEKEEAKCHTTTASRGATTGDAAPRRGASSAKGNGRKGRSAPVPAPGLCEENTGHRGVPSPSQHPSRPMSTSSPAKKKTDFLETSATLLAARRRAQARSAGADPAFTWPASASLDDDRPSTTTAAEIRPAGEAPHVVGGNTATRFARERPGGTRRTGEALFATSTALEYVFPNPCSPEARKMFASRARARSSRDASRTTSPPNIGGGRDCFGFTKSSPRSACRRAVTDTSAGLPPPSRAASTPGARARPLWAATGGGGSAVAMVSPVQIATSCVSDDKTAPPGSGTTAGAEVGAAARALQRHVQHKRGESPTQDFAEKNNGVPSRSATATGIAGKKARFHEETSRSKTELLRPSTTTAAHEFGTLRGRGRSLGSSGADNIGECGDVDVCVKVGGLGVGAAAKARLYRAYCSQRGGDYDREYRRHGGKETLERITLLNDTFR